MGNPAQQTIKQAKHSLCNDIGHAWISTTASNFRVCKRSNKVVQVRRDGTWVYLKPKANNRHADNQHAASSQESSLF